MQTLILLSALTLSNTMPISETVDETTLAQTVKNQIVKVQKEVDYQVRVSVTNTFLFQAKAALRIAKNNLISDPRKISLGE